MLYYRAITNGEVSYGEVDASLTSVTKLRKNAKGADIAYLDVSAVTQQVQDALPGHPEVLVMPIPFNGHVPANYPDREQRTLYVRNPGETDHSQVFVTADRKLKPYVLQYAVGALLNRDPDGLEISDEPFAIPAQKLTADEVEHVILQAHTDILHQSDSNAAYAAERATWPMKQAAATGALADNKADLLLLKAMLPVELQKGKEADEQAKALAKRILAKHSQMQQVVAKAEQFKQTALAALKAAKTDKALQAIVQDLPAQKQQVLDSFN